MGALRRHRFGLLLCFLLLGLVAVTPAGANENYRKFVTGYVNDHAGLLRPEEGRELAALLAAFDEQTTNQFIVVTLSTLPPGESLERFALRLAEAAQAGTAEQDNGLLLLIFSASTARHLQPPKGGYPRGTRGPVIYPPRSGNRPFRSSGGGKFRGGGGGFRGGGASGGW